MSTPSFPTLKWRERVTTASGVVYDNIITMQRAQQHAAQWGARCQYSVHGVHMDYNASTQTFPVWGCAPGVPPPMVHIDPTRPHVAQVKVRFVFRHLAMHADGRHASLYHVDLPTPTDPRTPLPYGFVYLTLRDTLEGPPARTPDAHCCVTLPPPIPLGAWGRDRTHGARRRHDHHRHRRPLEDLILTNNAVFLVQRSAAGDFAVYLLVKRHAHGHWMTHTPARRLLHWKCVQSVTLDQPDPCGDGSASCW